MEANKVSEKVIHLFSEGLSDQPATVRFATHAGGNCALLGTGSCKAKLIPLDSLTPPTRIGLIKADLEGMGMYMLRGAAETIRRDKPVLTLNLALFEKSVDDCKNCKKIKGCIDMAIDLEYLKMF